MTPRILLFAALLLLGCAPSTAPGTFQGRHPMKIGATVGMVADIVREVAGDRAEVTTIIGAGVDPHVYTPTRGDVAVLLRSDMIFYAGLLLEGQMSDVLEKIARRRKVVAVTEALRPGELLQGEGAKHHDPHVWMDVGGWIKAVEVVEGALTGFDPASAAPYRENARRYRADLERLDAYARRAIASIPAGQRVMVTAHDAFRYLGRAYGVEVLGIQGLSTESEAGLRDINRLVDLLVTRRIPAVFVETSVSDKNVRALIEGAAARGHRVVIGGELFSDAMGPPGTYKGTYVGMIDHNVTTIARALGGEAPARGFQGKLAAVH